MFIALLVYILIIKIHNLSLQNMVHISSREKKKKKKQRIDFPVAIHYFSVPRKLHMYRQK